MALTFSGSVAALYTRFGHWARLVREIVAHKGGASTSTVTASLSVHGTTLETDALSSTGGPATSSSIDGHWAAIESLRSGMTSAVSQLRGLAEKQFVAHVAADVPVVSTITDALNEVNRQMIAGSKSLNGSTLSVGAQTSLGSPTGDPNIVVSLKRGDGKNYQTPRAETLRFTCTLDQYTGAQTARREQITVYGAAALTQDVWSHLYPSGSGVNKALTLVDCSQDSSSASTTSGNLLANSDFETTSVNTFPGWIYDVGVATTNFLAYGSGYSGSNALKILSNSGSDQLAVYQKFTTALGSTGNAGGTPTTLAPGTLYALSFWLKAISAAPVAGVLRVSLTNGSGTVVADDAGVDNTLEIDLTGITTGFVAKNYVFRTPTIMPSELRLRFKTTTAITSGSSVVVDDVALASMTQLYTGGPSMAAFAGATAVVKGDSYTVAVGCTRGVLVDYLERFFGLEQKGIIFPYDDASGESEADTIVTA